MLSSSLNDYFAKTHYSVGSQKSSARSDVASTKQTGNPSYDVGSKSSPTKSIEKEKVLKMSAISEHQCHQSGINDVCVSPCGEHFITAGSDSTVKIFRLSSQLCVKSLICSSPIISVDVGQVRSLSADESQSQLVVAGCSDGSCRVWNLQEGIFQLNVMGHASKVQSCILLGKCYHYHFDFLTSIIDSNQFFFVPLLIFFE